MSGDKVRFRDLAGAAVKYPWFKPINPVDTEGFDLNVFAILLTKTTAKIAWQDQTEEVLPGVAVVPDYNMEDDNEVWPGEVVITNEKVAVAEDWVFQPKQVGVVQSVSSADRIAKVKWLPNAQVRYNQVGLDEHLDELSLLEGSTLGLETSLSDAYPVEEVTLYDIRTIGALSRRRGDFVVIEGCNNSTSLDDISWFGEVIDLNLDSTLTVRLGAAAEIRDVRVSPDRTMLVYSSDAAPSFMGDGFDDPYDSGDDLDDYDDMSEDTDESEEGEWMVNGQVVTQDEEWDTESEEDVDEDVDMEDAPAVTPIFDTNLNGSRNGRAERQHAEPIRDSSNGDALTELSMPVQEPSLIIPSTDNAPPAFDVLEASPPPNHPYLLPEPPPLTGARMKRIRRDHTILSTSLPPGIFARTYESRLDLLRIIIVGPLGTPYEYAPFVIDMRLPATYPQDPPEAYFHSWTNGQGPVNPNLYENGKICLSLLGTWHAGEKGEAWSSSRSTILQVLVSILGLVLVREPYYNEAGFEARAGSEDAKVPSQLYSERTYFRSRGFITYALRNGVEGFDELLDWLYLEKEKEGAPRLLEKSIEAARELVTAGDSATDVRAGLGKMSRGAIIMLERQVRELETVREQAEEKKKKKDKKEGVMGGGEVS
jgi:ubiquitin-conjugating enzyme E2 O